MRYWIGVGVAVLLALAVWVGPAEERPRAAAADKGSDEQIKHGEYLAIEVAHCDHCHTPQTDQGEPDKSKLLQGATLPIMPKKKTDKWEEQSPDITRGGLAGKWTEEQMVTFLTTGKNPDGEPPIPPMPVFHLKKDDAKAVTAYLRSLPGKKGKKSK